VLLIIKLGYKDTSFFQTACSLLINGKVINKKVILSNNKIFPVDNQQINEEKRVKGSKKSKNMQNSDDCM
jgi:hypothetical protein